MCAFLGGGAGGGGGEHFSLPSLLVVFLVGLASGSCAKDQESALGTRGNTRRFGGNHVRTRWESVSVHRLGDTAWAVGLLSWILCSLRCCVFYPVLAPSSLSYSFCSTISFLFICACHHISYFSLVCYVSVVPILIPALRAAATSWTSPGVRQGMAGRDSEAGLSADPRDDRWSKPTFLVLWLWSATESFGTGGCGGGGGGFARTYPCTPPLLLSGGSGS